MKIRRLVGVGAALAIAVSMTAFVPIPANAGPAAHIENGLAHKADQQGTVHVIVKVRAKADQQPILNDLSGKHHKYRLRVKYTDYPLLALDVDSAALAELSHSPDVASVQEDALSAPREARVMRERPHEDAVALPPRHRGKAAPVEAPVDPDVPELVQRLAILLGMSRQVHARLVVVAKMEQLMKARLGETLPRELPRQDRRRPRASPPRARPGAPSGGRDEVAEREGEPRRAVIVRVPLDVGVVVTVPQIHVDVHVAHDVGESQLPNRVPQHRLRGLAQGKVGRIPADAKARSRVGVVERSHPWSHFTTFVTMKMWRAMRPTRSAIGCKPRMPPRS